jgi:uncharacterized SAM-binding protein YcdF (DUF218 family)
LFLTLIVAGCALGVFFRIHPFLAITQRMPTDLLVVEGWISDSAIRGAAAEFTNGFYQRLFTTGGPVHGSGAYSNDYSTSASIGAGRLRKAGVPPQFVQMAPSRVRDRDRTYGSAVALRDWLREHDQHVTRINVLTEGVHARRSRLLFQKAFGDDVSVGVIAVPNSDYDESHWWRYSEGVKEVISEGAAYLYVRFFFHPDK